MRFSANLGFLFRGLALPEAIRAAKQHGFDAVECHQPYREDPGAVNRALAETGLKMLALNAPPGTDAAGEAGLAALVGRSAEAREAIDRAVDYAHSIGCENVHVTAGRAEGAQAFATFVENVGYAAERASQHGITALIEPLNPLEAPGYFLADLRTALRVLDEVGSPALKIMFDCYHLQILQGDLLRTFRNVRPQVGHIQFAGVPNRDEPDCGEVDYRWLLQAILDEGYDGYFGAEYRARRDDFGWMQGLRPRPKNAEDPSS